MSHSSIFIRTGFGSSPSAQVRSDGNLVTLGFYEEDGRTFHSETMTPEAALKIGSELRFAADQIIGRRYINEGRG